MSRKDNIETVVQCVVRACIDEGAPHLTNKEIAARTGLSAAAVAKAAWDAANDRIEPTDGYITVGTAYGSFGNTYDRKVQAWTVTKRHLIALLKEAQS